MTQLVFSPSSSTSILGKLKVLLFHLSITALLSIRPTRLGLYLQSLSNSDELCFKHDLHEQGRKLADLSEYEHLLWILRLCVLHVYWQIKRSRLPQDVKDLMHSLCCISHPGWQSTLDSIRCLGGKTAIGTHFYLHIAI